MAKIEQGLLGALSGRVGPVVCYVNKGRAIIRSAPSTIRNPRTAKQQRGRSTFGAAASLARGMRAALEVGLRDVAQQISARNLFVSLNRDCISLVDGEAVVDYSRVRVAEGGLTGVVFGEVQQEEGCRLTVEFAPWAEQFDRTGRPSDYVYLYAYVPQWGEGVLSTPAQRLEQRVELTLPAYYSGSELQLYGFVWNRKNDASPSVWLGCREL